MSDTNLGTLSFSTEVTDEYEAVSPRQIFAEGFYTLYATFRYEGMEDGMVWSWVWRSTARSLRAATRCGPTEMKVPAIFILRRKKALTPGAIRLTYG